MDKKTIEQNIVTKKTDEGYYVEVFNDGKLAWTDTFKTEKELNWFIQSCNKGKEFGTYFSQNDARKMLENNEISVNVFYRHPLGYRFAEIYQNDIKPRDNEHGFSVMCVNKDNCLDIIDVSTMDEAFQVLKDAENGKI